MKSKVCFLFLFMIIIPRTLEKGFVSESESQLDYSDNNSENEDESNEKSDSKETTDNSDSDQPDDTLESEEEENEEENEELGLDKPSNDHSEGSGFETESNSSVEDGSGLEEEIIGSEMEVSNLVPSIEEADLDHSGSGPLDEKDVKDLSYAVLQLDDITEDYTKEKEEDEESECSKELFGCCSGSQLPAHGPRSEGCCLLSEFGCCQDNIRPAAGLSGEGCGCETSQFGCCPDGKTAMREANKERCGCAYSKFGCCQDQHHEALGENYEGCPCFTFDNGCCEDGKTIANGPNHEDCPGCQNTLFGCCPDGFTPAQGELFQGCECAASQFGCCPDGLSTATGPEFEGCSMKPGESCYFKQDKGKCEDFSVKWFFDGKEGRCSRFWYGGCEGNSNKFEDVETCEETCVKPPGNGRCYLPKVRGICTGDYERFYYDQIYKQCVQFSYGGCLGNDNQFTTKLECEQTCIRSDNLAICEQPAAEAGPCGGNFTRWFYEESTGRCQAFKYGGCQGNKNRFMSQQECENSCRHKKVTLDTAAVCKQDIETGNCNETHARWGFNQAIRKCRPFYYSGCDGNSNNFKSVEECEHRCPDAFPPELEVVNKLLNIEEGTKTVLEIAVEGNPLPKIIWQHDSETINIQDRFKLRDDRSLVILETRMEDAGSWTVIADNGVGKVARRQISLSVYPSQIPIKVKIAAENTTFSTGSSIRLECKVEGFPIPTMVWLKNNARLPKSTRIFVEDERFLVINRASPIDGGAYICRARNENMQNQAVVDIEVLQGATPLQCQDHPQFANCALIVRVKYCNKNEKLAKLCCHSCVQSGQIAGPPA